MQILYGLFLYFFNAYYIYSPAQTFFVCSAKLSIIFDICKKKRDYFSITPHFFITSFVAQSLVLQTHDTILHTHYYMDISIYYRQSAQSAFEWHLLHLAY